MADYDGLPLNTPTKIRTVGDYETWATRTVNGGTVEQRVIAGSPTALAQAAQATADANATTIRSTAQPNISANVTALGVADPTAGNNTYLAAANPSATNTTYAALASPSVAQTNAEVKALANQINALYAQVVSLTNQAKIREARIRALTQQNNYLLRLSLGQFDATT